MYGAGEIWKKECMVTPSALTAATPVGATTIAVLALRLSTSFRKVVLPVPALPVRKMLTPVCSTKSHARARFSSGFIDGFAVLLVPEGEFVVGCMCEPEGVYIPKV